MPDKKNLFPTNLQNMIFYRSSAQIFLFRPDEGVNSLTVWLPYKRDSRSHVKVVETVWFLPYLILVWPFSDWGGRKLGNEKESKFDSGVRGRLEAAGIRPSELQKTRQSNNFNGSPCVVIDTKPDLWLSLAIGPDGLGEWCGKRMRGPHHLDSCRW